MHTPSEYIPTLTGFWATSGWADLIHIVGPACFTLGLYIDARNPVQRNRRGRDEERPRSYSAGKIYES